MHEIAVIFLTVHCIFKSLGGACHFSRQTWWYVLCCLLQICLYCCFVAFVSDPHYSSPRRGGLSGQQGQAYHTGGKAKAIQPVPCSSHVRDKDDHPVHHMDFSVTWIPPGWNKPTETKKADTLLIDPQPPRRSPCSMGVDPSQVIGISFQKPLSKLPLSLSSLISVTRILRLWAFRGFRYAALRAGCLWRLVTLPWQCWNPFFPSQRSHSFHHSNTGY